MPADLNVFGNLMDITPQERKTTLSLASVYAFRMLGLFMILPIFSVVAHRYAGANSLLIGWALGIYGLTQAILQIPFGMASDRIGRKPVIVFGLLLFLIGSVIAALSHTIDGVILGRALQGAGAVGSTLTALLADNVRDEHRLKAMSVIGMTIGLSFVTAIIVGPILNSVIGLSGIFWLIALLALIGIAVVLFAVPTAQQHVLHRDSEPVLGQFRKMLKHPELLRLDFGIFAMHAILTALFIAVPILLVHTAGISEKHQWVLYLPVLILAFIAMVPFIIIAEAKRKMKPVFVGAIVVLTLSVCGLWKFYHSAWAIGVVLFFFFTAFTLLEASLPSLVAKIAPAGGKGTAMGIYSSSQFLGIFVGGAVGGWLFNHYGLNKGLLFCAILGCIWFLLAITMKKPQHLSSKILHLAKVDNVKALHTKLIAIPGVAEAMVSPEEHLAYLKVDKKILAEKDLEQFKL